MMNTDILIDVYMRHFTFQTTFLKINSTQLYMTMVAMTSLLNVLNISIDSLR